MLNGQHFKVTGYNGSQYALKIKIEKDGTTSITGFYSENQKKLNKFLSGNNKGLVGSCGTVRIQNSKYLKLLPDYYAETQSKKYAGVEEFRTWLIKNVA